MNKKLLSLFSVIVLSVVVLASCGRTRTGPLSCAASTVDYTEDLSQYINNQTKANCERVAKSIKELFQSCSALTAVDREEYEEIENDLDCDSL